MKGNYSVRKNRSCTDVPMVVVFFAYISLMIGLTINGYRNGDHENLIAPIDENNRFCGVKTDEYDYEKFKYLYFPGLGVDPSVKELKTAKTLVETKVMIHSDYTYESLDRRKYPPQ